MKSVYKKMDDFLTLATRAHPDRLALIDGDQRLSYHELNTAVAELSACLTAHGIQQSQRVAVLLDRSRDSVQLVHALVRIGASLVPLNTRLTADEMDYQVENAACNWILRTTPSPLGGRLGRGLDSSTHVDDLPRNAPDPYLVGTLELDAEFGILFTSGTTGKPKGARLLWKNIFASAKASAERLGAYPDDRWLLTLPLYHIGGLSILLRSALYGTAVILPNFTDDQFNLTQLQARMQVTQPTMISLVPTMLHRLLDDAARSTHLRRSSLIANGEIASAEELPRKFPESLRLILLGGAAASLKLLERTFAQNLAVAMTYGLTECASQVATATPDEARQKSGSVGKPLLGVRVEIRDDEGQALPSGEIGNIHVAGDVVMSGYLHQAEVQEWLRTGDLGYLDADGDLFIVQRRSDLIVSGGENIYPAEVEAVLLQHPNVESACVVGIPDKQWGQRVAAAIVVRRTSFDGTMPNNEQNAHRHSNIQGDGATHHQFEKEIIAFCRQHLAGYKIPRKIRVLDALPQTASGKVKRQDVVNLLIGTE